MKLFGVVVFVLAIAVVAQETTQPARSRPLATYSAHGTFLGLDPATGEACIAHDDVPGYMEAMTMNFEVRDEDTLRLLRPGDTLDFRLCIQGVHVWVDRLYKTGSGTAPLLDRDAPAARELAIGDPLPDVPLVDAAGHAIRLHDFGGEVLVCTFVYSGCPLPTYCPLMNRNLQAAATLLPQLGVRDGWHLLSISFDAARDTPAVLADQAQTWSADPSHWTFAAASDDAIRALGDGLGLEVRRSANGQLSHNLRTVVVDGSGRVRKIFRGNHWTPQELAAAVRAAERAQS